MNVLMTVAVVGAAAIGSWVEAALVVALFGLGQTLESWAVERTRGSIQALMDLSPDEALVRDGDHEHVAKVEDVLVGEVVVVKPGARVPMDGEIVKGTSAIDESPITGESLPRAKEVGDEVYAGTINQRGALEVRVTARATDSTLARLIKMVEEAQGQKAPSQRWVDSFAKYYTPVVMGVALVTAVGPPLLLGASWSAWIYRALALLDPGLPLRAGDLDAGEHRLGHRRRQSPRRADQGRRTPRGGREPAGGGLRQDGDADRGLPPGDRGAELRRQQRLGIEQGRRPGPRQRGRPGAGARRLGRTRLRASAGRRHSARRESPRLDPVAGDRLRGAARPGSAGTAGRATLPGGQPAALRRPRRAGQRCRSGRRSRPGSDGARPSSCWARTTGPWGPSASPTRCGRRAGTWSGNCTKSASSRC